MATEKTNVTEDFEERSSVSVVEEVALVVPESDDPSLPMMTFRTWFLGITSCVILIFLNTFFIDRTQPLTITAYLMQIAVLPIGKFIAKTLPKKQYKILVWEQDIQLPWWGMLFASFFVTLPIGVIEATTNQLVGTLVAGIVNLAVAWWMLGNICDVDALPLTCLSYGDSSDQADCLLTEVYTETWCGYSSSEHFCLYQSGS